MKKMIRRIPVLGPIAARLYAALRSWRAAPQAFPGSEAYWEQRYARGGDSGAGSYGRLAAFKAEVLNDFVREHEVASVIEFGCGDGNQLTLARYPRYLGFDVSETAVASCRARFPADATRRFALMNDYRGERAELALSLDVIYHLVEDAVFEDYMKRLFEASTRYVIIYSSDVDDEPARAATHVRQRRFSGWIEAHAPAWKRIARIPNRYPYRGEFREGSFSEFHVFERNA